MGKTGYDPPASTGMIALVTGANSGIGLEAARGLARAGAEVLLACRSVERGERAAADIRDAEPAAKLEVLELDLASLASVSAAAERVFGKRERLDLLVNNAGVMALPRLETADGFEMQIGVNHLGHFALTGLLLPTLLAAPAARIVNVSSMMHRIGSMRLDDIHSRRRYGRWRAYGQSKLANLLFTFELHRRLTEAGAPAMAVACHPGYSATNLHTAGAAIGGARARARVMGFFGRSLGQSAEAGSLPTLMAATSPEVEGGDFIGPSGFCEIRGAPRKVTPHAKARDVETARALWEISERETGVRYTLTPA